MAMKFMYITNRPEVARIAERAGVDRIFVDMEYIGKSDRQGGMDTVQLHHTPEDAARIKAAVTTAQVMVRVNPIHEASDCYGSSQEEIDAVAAAGADIMMLPYFKTAEEVKAFVRMVDGRARTLLLVETPEAADALDEILDIPGVDEIFIGLNDLSLGMGRRFMFELLKDGTVEQLCLKCRLKGKPYGFGGIAAIGTGTLPAENILVEHYRMGSDCVILSRSFCNTEKITDLEEIRRIFDTGVRAIREKEREIEPFARFFRENIAFVSEKVDVICDAIAKREKQR